MSTSGGVSPLTLPVEQLPSGARVAYLSPGNNGLGAPPNNSERLCQFLVGGTGISITAIGFEVTTGTTDPATFIPIIRADAGWEPGNLIVGANSGAANAVAVVEVALGSTLKLAPGLYWGGGVIQNAPTTAPTFRTCSPATWMPAPGYISQGAAPAAGYGATAQSQTYAGAPPLAWSGVPSLSNVCPRVWFVLA